MTAVIGVEGLTRRFRRGRETVLALDDVSLSIYAGELTVAAGPSGSGKTTLLSILAGLDRPDAGRVVTGPPLPEGVPPDLLGWRDLAFVPQSLGLLDELTVYENVDLPARLSGASADNPSANVPGGSAGSPGSIDSAGSPGSIDSADELLDLLEISHLSARYPSLISGGEQQRTAVGRALRLRPAVLLGDEPTGHQDRGRVDLVLGILRQHAYAGHAVLVSSHDEAVIAAADRVVTMADGRIVSDVWTAAVQNRS